MANSPQKRRKECGNLNQNSSCEFLYQFIFTYEISTLYADSKDEAMTICDGAIRDLLRHPYGLGLSMGPRMRCMSSLFSAKFLC